jgi:hypothetical protein
MKSLVQAVAATAAAVALMLPAVSFAQSNAPVSRADVHTQRVQLEQDGYRPNSDRTQYPLNIQRGEARVDAQSQATSNDGYGGVSAGTTASGIDFLPGSNTGLKSIYVGH